MKAAAESTVKEIKRCSKTHSRLANEIGKTIIYREDIVESLNKSAEGEGEREFKDSSPAIPGPLIRLQLLDCWMSCDSRKCLRPGIKKDTQWAESRLRNWRSLHTDAVIQGHAAHLPRDRRLPVGLQFVELVLLCILSLINEKHMLFLIYRRSCPVIIESIRQRSNRMHQRGDVGALEF